MKIKEHVLSMANFRKLIAWSVAVTLLFASPFVLAQEEDLDGLLGDLEGESAVAEAVEPAPEPAAEAVEASAPAEEPAVEASAPLDAPAEESADESDTDELLAEMGNVEKPKAAPAMSPEEEAELLARVRAQEVVRRKAFDEEAKREIREARESMAAEEYAEAARHYNNALKLLTDNASSRKFRKECAQGIAESVYRAAMSEYRLGRRSRAVKLMNKAVDLRHPKARGQLESWNAAGDPDVGKTDRSEISHRRNDDSYKTKHDKVIKHLRRSRQLYSQRELDEALDECELALLADPYNQEAIRLRHAIEKKRRYILEDEQLAARDGMIADVAEKWRPVYAPNAREVDEVAAHTVKREVGEDPERAVEQSIIKRMKEMRLPAISFKPPATIIDAVEFFRGASRDFGDPELPIEQRGFNFVLKTPEALRQQTAQTSDEAESDDFSDSGDEEEDESAGGIAGVPVIPMITASDISFYEALKLVCESVDYKFKVQGTIVMVMHKDMSTDEMVTRSYPVLAQFLDRMGSAQSDIKEMKSFGNFGDSRAGRRKSGDEGEDQERDWKAFFSLMGVQWPEGSSIIYIKTIGKLRVKNTYENLAELEKALTELNVDQKLIEIEARFVEVCQDDLNSLGFEWILNNDLNLNMGKLGKFLPIEKGGFKTITDPDTYIDHIQTANDGGVITETITRETIKGATRTGWQSGADGVKSRNIGLNKFGGDAAYQNNMRYLSTSGNHISGQSQFTNDQFARLNAFIGSADLSMILHMLSQRSDTDLLSSPKVLTRPGEEAVMKVVTEYIYPTDYEVSLSSSSSSGGSYGSSGGSSQQIAIVEPQSFTMREVGVILDVTPTLTDDGNLIDLKLDTKVVDEPEWHNYGMKIPTSGNTALQNFTGIGEIMTGLGSIFTTFGSRIPDTLVSALTGQVTASATEALENLSKNDSNIEYYDVPMEQPFFHVRSIESSVSIYPGATIVMGGLITETRLAMDDKIPFLGDLPFIGRLFRSHAEKTSKRNLLIFVTTRLVDTRGREVTMNGTEVKDTEVKAAPVAE